MFFDLYNTELNSSQKNHYLMQIRNLREFMNNAESLHTAQIEWLKNNFVELIGLVPLRVFEINSFSKPFERLVINQDITGGLNSRLHSVEQLRYPPLAIADKIDYNRASLKGQSVFYAGTMGALQISVEVRPQTGQLVTTSKWEFVGEEPLKMITICQDVEMAMKNPDELLDPFNEYNRCVMQMKPNNQEVITAVMTLITDAFTRQVNPKNKQGYLMSALISNFFYSMKDEEVDAIYYPSVPNNGSAMNIAVKPEMLDRKFKFVGANEAIVFSHPNGTSRGWFQHSTGDTKQYDFASLKLDWVNSPIVDPRIHELMELYKVSLE